MELIKNKLRTLAYTFDWRTSENISMIKKAYDKLYSWLPLPYTYIKIKSQLISPCKFFAFNQDCNPEICRDWLELYELSVRIGAITKDSLFYKHLDNFKNDLLCPDKIVEVKSKRSFLYWSGYTGLALESKWNKKEKIYNDLLFRCALIFKYIEKYN